VGLKISYLSVGVVLLITANFQPYIQIGPLIPHRMVSTSVHAEFILPMVIKLKKLGEATMVTAGAFAPELPQKALWAKPITVRLRTKKKNGRQS
jgi:hypothetical protein